MFIYLCLFVVCCLLLEEGSGSSGGSEELERLEGLSDRLEGLYPARLSPMRDESDGSDSPLQLAAGKKPLPSKIPVPSQSRRSPLMSPEALRVQEPVGLLVPIKEMELARVRQQLELDLELGRRKLREQELERERASDESEQRIAALKGYCLQ